MKTRAEREAFWAALDARFNGHVPHAAHFRAPEQHGPMRHFDREMSCASPGCGSPTYFKLRGVPHCMIHCLREMNEMLIGAGVSC